MTRTWAILFATMNISGTTTLLILVLAAAAWAVVIYNRFISRKNRVQEAWSGIDVQLKRRHNLIPNLIETVRGYAKHETGLLQELTSLRTGDGDPATRSADELRISSALQHLLAVAENYPDLKASENFLDLQNNLDDIETHIQQARRYYNGAVRDFNTLCESFPSNLIARLFRFLPAQYFEIELPTQREVPSVKF